ncbi:MAG: sigma-54 dependent transcriptional regulator, partial [Gemmatimonadota bacterium]
ARAVHEQSGREGQFITVNCAALPEGLVESALFGHERGAFTGATARTQGAFERAHKGTLLLDEISEMRLDLQSKLLRAIQEQEFERVGGSQTIRVDTRIIATTNRELLREVDAGRFRRDLYYRLSVVPIRTPPLREHPDDIPPLVEHFLKIASGQIGVKPPVVPPETMAALARYQWPGNVRELANAMERAVILNRSGRLSLDAFPIFAAAALAATAAAARTDPATLDLAALEEQTIARALQSTGGNRTRAAKLLGISERTLRNKLNPKTEAVEPVEHK